MTIPLADLVAQYRTIQSDIDGAIRSVLEGGHFILGPNTKALEREIAAYLGVGSAVGVDMMLLFVVRSSPNSLVAHGVLHRSTELALIGPPGVFIGAPRCRCCLATKR